MHPRVDPTHAAAQNCKQKQDALLGLVQAWHSVQARQMQPCTHANQQALVGEPKGMDCPRHEQQRHLFQPLPLDNGRGRAEGCQEITFSPAAWQAGPDVSGAAARSAKT